MVELSFAFDHDLLEVDACNHAGAPAVAMAVKPNLLMDGERLGRNDCTRSRVQGAHDEVTS